MTFALTRFMSTATASYGVYALVNPRHLGNLLTSDRKKQDSFDVLARTYGGRDLALSAFGIFGRSEKVLTAAMLLRIAMDLTDAAVLSREAESDEARTMVLGATLGWASLNALALMVDRRRARR